MEWLASVVKFWETQATAAGKTKYRQFGKTAKRAWMYLGKSYNELYVDSDNPEDEPFRVPHPPKWQARLNKSREFVSLYTPYLHSQIPNFLVAPWRPPLPPLLQQMGIESPELAQQEEMICSMMQWFINYVPIETNMIQDTRNALQEALVKGRGVVFFELDEGPNGVIPVASFDSVDNLLIDPDCVMYRDANFIMRKRRRSKWIVAEEWDIPVEDLPATLQTHFRDAVGEARKEEPNERTNDIVEYWEVWSRMGMGQKSFYSDSDLKNLNAELDALGDNVYLCICPGVKYPLNLHPKWFEGEDRAVQMQERCRWPLEFYDDIANPWPCEFLDFIGNVDNPWATSPLEAALPLQNFLDHAYSFLMGRMRASTRALVFAWKELSQEMQDRIVNGGDLELILSDDPVNKENLDKFVNVFQFEPLRTDLWKVIEMVSREFERQTGTDPLLYGASTGASMRSATEANYRESHLTSRPQDYAAIVESWLSRIARKIGVAARMYVGPETIANLFREPVQEAPAIDETGEPVPVYGNRTMAWMQLIHTDNPAEASAELLFSVEAGSGQRKNQAKRDTDAKTLIEALPNVVQILDASLKVHNPSIYNTMVSTLGQLLDMPLEGMLLTAPPQEQGDPEQEAAIAQKEQEAALKEQDAAMRNQQAQQDAELQGVASQQDMDMQAAKHEQEMRHREESHTQELRLKQAQMRTQAQSAKKNHPQSGKR
jgi:hypothetical protein